MLGQYHLEMQDPSVLLKKLYPQLSEEELITAKDNLGRYLLVAWEVAGAILAETPVDFGVPPSTLKERSNSNLKDQS